MNFAKPVVKTMRWQRSRDKHTRQNDGYPRARWALLLILVRDAWPERVHPLGCGTALLILRRRWKKGVSSCVGEPLQAAQGVGDLLPRDLEALGQDEAELP